MARAGPRGGRTPSTPSSGCSCAARSDARANESDGGCASHWRGLYGLAVMKTRSRGTCPAVCIRPNSRHARSRRPCAARSDRNRAATEWLPSNAKAKASRGSRAVPARRPWRSSRARLTGRLERRRKRRSSRIVSPGREPGTPRLRSCGARARIARKVLQSRAPAFPRAVPRTSQISVRFVAIRITVVSSPNRGLSGVEASRRGIRCELPAVVREGLLSGRRVANPADSRLATSIYPCATAMVGVGRGVDGGGASFAVQSRDRDQSASGEYALRRPGSTAGVWLRTHVDFLPA